MTARPPEKCLDHSSIAKAREKVATELAAFRSRFGRIATVERLYAEHLERYDERARELDAAYRGERPRPPEATS